MRLYLNVKEAPVIKSALQCMLNVIPPLSDDDHKTVERVIQRMELCEQLQDNLKRSN